MRWTLLTLVLLASAGAFALGAWLGARPAEPDARSSRRAVVRPWWALPFALGALGVAARHLSTGAARRGAALLALLLGVGAAQRLWVTARFDPATVTGRVAQDGVCLQTTEFTWTPAHADGALPRRLARRARVVALSRARAYTSPVRWLLFFVVLLVSLLGAALGAWVGKGGEAPGPDGKPSAATTRRATIVVGVCLLVLLVRMVFRYLPAAEHGLLPYDWYAVVHPWLSMPFAFVILGIGPRHMSTPLSRKGVAVFAVLLGLVAVQRLWITARFDPATVTGKIERDAVCMQTTDYTCGAASAVMLLHQAGIASDEREMCERCWTNGLTGTDELCVCRGLRQKLEGTGREVVFEEADWARLRGLGRPAMTTVAFSFMVDHWVVVLEATDADVLVLDPLAGRQRQPRATFLEKWRGSLIWIR